MVAAACGGGSGEEAAPTATPVPTPGPTATSAPESTATPDFDLADIEFPEVFPLTGMDYDDPAEAAHPAVALKLDNNPASLPPTGIVDADVVVEILVEGRLTRLLPVFHSTMPERAGPVRSGRSSDPDILGAFGTPLFAWWGAMEVVQGEIAAGETDGKLVDAGVYQHPELYYRVDRPGVALEHTGYTNPPDVLALAPEGSEPPPLFARWLGDTEALSGRTEEVAGIAIDWGNTPVAFVWSDEDSAWLRWQYGERHVDDDERQVAVQNIVVLDTPYGASAAKASSPRALTVGEGDAVFYLDGMRVKGSWRRSSANEPWELLDGDGQPIELRKGKTFVELTDRRTTVLTRAEADALLDG